MAIRELTDAEVDVLLEKEHQKVGRDIKIMLSLLSLSISPLFIYVAIHS